MLGGHHGRGFPSLKHSYRSGCQFLVPRAFFSYTINPNPISSLLILRLYRQPPYHLIAISILNFTMVTTGFALASLLAYFDNLSLYENIMLTITMSGLVVMLTPFFSPAVPREAHPDRPVTVWVAVLLCVGVMAIQLTNIVMWREAALFPSGTSIVIAFFSFTATLGVTLVFNSSYAFAFPPAAFPSLFLATTLPYDLAIAQYCLKFGNERLFKLQICLVGLKSLLVLAGLVLRRRLTPDRPFTADHQFFLPWSSFISIPGLSPRFSIGDLPDLLWDDGSRVVYMQFCRHWDQGDTPIPSLLCHVLTPSSGRELKWRSSHGVVSDTPPLLDI